MVTEQNYTMSGFGKNIVRLRKAKRWSQEQLADHSRISVRTIQRIENAASQPRNHTLKTLAKAFEVELEVLLAEEEFETALPLQDIEKIRKMNAAALTLVVFPLGNLIVPWLLWLRYQKPSELKSTYRQMLSFHVLWTLITLILLALTPPITQAITGSVAVGKFPLLIVIYSLLVVTNLAFVVRAALQLSQNNSNIFPGVPKLL
jgi:transcriptional regulator with XRE-family HTH domain